MRHLGGEDYVAVDGNWYLNNLENLRRLGIKGGLSRQMAEQMVDGYDLTWKILRGEKKRGRPSNYVEIEAGKLLIQVVRNEKARRSGG